MKRIVVLGCAGSGKTTFARRLGEALQAPVICLDDIWNSDRAGGSMPRFRQVLETMHAGDAWVSDGNFAQATFDLRLPRADLIVWLERPRALCLWRAAGRVFRPGEAHRLRDLPKVIRFIWNFDRINRPKIEAARKEFGVDLPVVRLTCKRETEAFLRLTNRWDGDGGEATGVYLDDRSYR
ncbi:MAG TPA: hypothetical protein VMD53_14370 [Rhizomicrobium sp.]|nr:hypothetical protein [Rhizomicrobium sp.]